ncbi:sterigmatocystin 8-O-methyltransferase [Camillea tinctor]|nr:sterigmatocystin 8-O-methyltransferase [Camillea tinctor]
MSLDQSSALIEQLSRLGQKVSDGDHNARMEALELSRRLSSSLEKPENTALDLAFSPFIVIAARISIDLNLFTLIVNRNGPITSKELAELSGGEELLIIQILRPLASTGFVEEVGERMWIATPVTRAMAKEGIAAGHRLIGDMGVGVAMKAPAYLREAGYRCPVDPRDGFLQYAFQTKLTAFQFYMSRPQVLDDLNTFTGIAMGARENWVDWFPVEERLSNEVTITDSSPLLVDVGGGKGQDLIAFRSKYPNLKGRLILQDLEPTISQIQNIDPAIELVAYDFFTEQPVTGSRAYFYHHVLHDWSDFKCLTILEQVKKAMRPGYSKLLLHEMIVPERGASTFHAMFDLSMMAFNAGMERTERQWEALLDEAGFRVVKFWLPMQNDADGIIEVMLNE